MKRQDKKIEDFLKEGVASMLCDVDIEKLGYRDLKKVQMKGMWRGIELAEEKGLTVRKLPVGEAWDIVQEFIEKPEELKPFCEIPATKEREVR
jgi:hypothetical protein